MEDNSESVHTNTQIVDELAGQINKGSTFEALLDPSEIDFLVKLMPKGYTVTNQFRAPRNRVTKLVGVDLFQPEPILQDYKDDILIKRPSRPSKDRLRPTEYSYGVPKFTKNISELVKKCQKVLQQVQKHKYSQPFLKPVDY